VDHIVISLADASQVVVPVLGAPHELGKYGKDSDGFNGQLLAVEGESRTDIDIIGGCSRRLAWGDLGEGPLGQWAICCVKRVRVSLVYGDINLGEACKVWLELIFAVLVAVELVALGWDIYPETALAGYGTAALDLKAKDMGTLRRGRGQVDVRARDVWGPGVGQGQQVDGLGPGLGYRRVRHCDGNAIDTENQRVEAATIIMLVIMVGLRRGGRRM